MDYSIADKAKIEVLPSIVQSGLITAGHAAAHYSAGNSMVFEEAGVMEAGLTVLGVSFAVTYTYNVIGWKYNERLVRYWKSL